MRDVYHEQLDAITASLIEMSRLVGSAISRSTTALLDADLSLAQSVVDGDAEVDEIYRHVEESVIDVMARQQPVASDLRTLTTSLRISADLERSGDLALHLAKLARRRYPSSAIPPELRDTIVEMGQVAERIVAKAGSVIASRDVQRAGELESDDDVMDELHRKLFNRMLSDDWSHGVDTAIDIALAGRYYERFADHAVSVARRVVFLVTGERVAAP
ncbi:MAG: phosphate signaling complex protein PhoU [Actinomycetota bacterium]|nr:phosphate signaling complex protein PhoU [Actinomycetota bacterium]